MLAEACSGGVWRHLTLVVPALVDRGLPVDLILSDIRSDPGFDGDLARLRNLGCTVHGVPMLRRPAPLADCSAALRVRRLLRQCRPCILHTHASKAGVIGRIAALGLDDVRTVHSPHAFFFEAWPAGARRKTGETLERLLARRTDAYILVSRAEHEIAAKVCRLPTNRLHTIENGLPGSFFSQLKTRTEARRELGIPATETAIGFVGRICSQKGPDILIDAIAELTQPMGAPSIPQFYFLGDGPGRARLEARAAARKTASCITWLGHRPDAAQLWAAFDLAVFPSRYEALPYALIEAMGAGVPAIVSDIPGHCPHPAMRSHLVRFEKGAAETLARALRDLVTDAQRRSALSQWESDLVRSEFTLARQAMRLCRFYTTLEPRG